LLSHWYLARLIWPWWWRPYVPSKHRLNFDGLHRFISQNELRFWKPVELRNRNIFIVSRCGKSPASDRGGSRLIPGHSVWDL
jgi:hypothetical protein